MAKKKTDGLWEAKFEEACKRCHKKNISRTVDKILQRISRTKSSLIARSKKYEVPCEVTLDELKQLVYDNYGKPCRYCGRVVMLKNMVFDHIIPISKNGSSNIDNLQLICRTSNGMKGSLTEEHFTMLRDWLDTVPEELKKDISIRLSKGIH